LPLREDEDSLNAGPYLLGTNCENVVKNHVAAALDLQNSLLAGCCWDTVLVIVLEKAIQTGAVESNALGLDDSQAPSRLTAVCFTIRKGRVAWKRLANFEWLWCDGSRLVIRSLRLNVP
jgi:hypothetical protein